MAKKKNVAVSITQYQKEFIEYWRYKLYELPSQAGYYLTCGRDTLVYFWQLSKLFPELTFNPISCQGCNEVVDMVHYVYEQYDKYDKANLITETVASEVA